MIVSEETKAHARKILDYIALHPEEHYQGSWVGDLDHIPANATVETGCGTTMCIAGTSVFVEEGVAGLRGVYSFAEQLYAKFEDDVKKWYALAPEVRTVGNYPTYDSYGDLFMKKAGERLGLNAEESHALFLRSADYPNEDSVRALRAIADGDRYRFETIIESF